MTRSSGPLPVDEDGWIERVLDRVGTLEGRGVLVGPGHDCAALDLGGAPAVVTTDVLVDGVHFELETCGPAAAAEKALLVNLSDLAAAAAIPVAFEVGVVLPRSGPRDLLDGLAQGFAATARRWRCALVGGDTNVGPGPLVLAVTALGRPGPAGVLTRAGARPGDRLSVTGALGGSRHGRHLRFVPRVEEGLALARAGIPHAMMDLSDGLHRDLPRLCRASQVGALVRAADVPVHPDVEATGRAALARALDDGEDFELLVAHAPLAAAQRAALLASGVELVEIGEVLPRAEGLVLAEGDVRRPFGTGGWDHFQTRG